MVSHSRGRWASAWQRRRSRRCWLYRRCSRMQPGGKRADRSQIEYSDRLPTLGRPPKPQATAKAPSKLLPTANILRINSWKSEDLTTDEYLHPTGNSAIEMICCRFAFHLDSSHTCHSRSSQLPRFLICLQYLHPSRAYGSLFFEKVSVPY